MFSVVSVFDMSTAHLVGSSAGIATGYGLDGPGSNPGVGKVFRTSPDRPFIFLFRFIIANDEILLLLS